MSTTATPATVETLRRRAARFALDFAGATYEMGQAQNFIRGLCDMFDLPHLRAVSFEHKVKKVSGKSGRIDGFFPGQIHPNPPPVPAWSKPPSRC